MFERQIEISPASIRHDTDEVALPAFAVGGDDKGIGAVIDQFLALHTKHRGAGEVDLGDQAGIAEGEIAERGKFVEMHVVLAGFLQGYLGLAQGLVLHLQFYLVFMEFMQECFC